MRGFWLSKWYENEGMSKARTEMLSSLAAMVDNGDLVTPPLNPIPLSHFKPALESTLAGFKSGKFIFKMS